MYCAQAAPGLPCYDISDSRGTLLPYLNFLREEMTRVTISKKHTLSNAHRPFFFNCALLSLQSSILRHQGSSRTSHLRHKDAPTASQLLTRSSKDLNFYSAAKPQDPARSCSASTSNIPWQTNHTYLMAQSVGCSRSPGMFEVHWKEHMLVFSRTCCRHMSNTFFILITLMLTVSLNNESNEIATSVILRYTSVHHTSAIAIELPSFFLSFRARLAKCTIPSVCYSPSAKYIYHYSNTILTDRAPL